MITTIVHSFDWQAQVYSPFSPPSTGKCENYWKKTNTHYTLAFEGTIHDPKKKKLKMKSKRERDSWNIRESKKHRTCEPTIQRLKTHKIVQYKFTQKQRRPHAYCGEMSQVSTEYLGPYNLLFQTSTLQNFGENGSSN